MQNAGDYYQRAPRCCPGRSGNSSSSNNNNNNAGTGVRGAELLCCCCSCSTATSTKTPGLLMSLAVCVLVLGYTLLGAFVFMALEGGLKSDVTTGNGKRHFHPCSLSLSSTSSPAYMLETNPVRIPISLCLIIMLMYICGGAVMFNRLEGWSLLEGGYFCFTSLGTIGFGDLMPVGRNAPSTTLEELSLCACSLYILAGMGLIAMCFNLVQEEVVRVVRVFGRTCGMSSGVVVGPIGGTAVAAPSLKADLDDGGGTSDSRLSEQEEEAIAMSMVPAGS